MHVKHANVSVLDVAEILPFTIRAAKSTVQELKNASIAREELERFIAKLEKNFGEPIWYIGFDVIGEKFYERFLFDKGGFLEILMEAPVAIVAHFVSEKRAKNFSAALKKTLKEILPKTAASRLLIDSIKEASEEHAELKVHKWHKIRKIKKSVNDV